MGWSQEFLGEVLWLVIQGMLGNRVMQELNGLNIYSLYRKARRVKKWDKLARNCFLESFQMLIFRAKNEYLGVKLLEHWGCLMMYICLKRTLFVTVWMWPERTTSLFYCPQNLKLAMLFTSCFSFAAINQESLSVVQVTLIKMRGQSVESLHQVRERLLSRRVCVWALNRGPV